MNTTTTLTTPPYTPFGSSFWVGFAILFIVIVNAVFLFFRYMGWVD